MTRRSSLSRAGLLLILASLGGCGSTAQVIETGHAGDALTPQIALDASGNAIAVWGQFDGTRSSIRASRFSAASGAWGTAQPIGTDNAGSAILPRAVLDAGGNAVAVWHQSDGTRSNIWSSRFSAASGAWGAAEKIETDDAGDAFGPRIAIDASGNAIAVWMQSDGARFSIWANRFSAVPGTWGVPEPIETGNAGSASSPQVALNASGNAIAVWEQTDGTRFNIWANRFSAASGAWGAAQLIEIEPGGASSPQVAIDRTGNAIAVWVQAGGGRFNVWANRFGVSAAGGTWGAAQLIETDDAGDALTPQVAVDASGNAIAVWTQSDGARFNVWARRFSAAIATWGAAQLIETDDAGSAFFPQVAIDGSGNAIAVWQQFDGALTNIWANRFSAASGAWGAAKLIETDDAGGAFFPQIAIDASANAIVVWQQADGTHSNIWARRLHRGEP